MSVTIELKQAGTNVGVNRSVFFYQINGLLSVGSGGLVSVKRAMAALSKLRGEIRQKDFPESGKNWRFTDAQIVSIDSPDAATGFVSYDREPADPDSVTVRMGTIVRTVTTQVDIDGEPITVAYKGEVGEEKEISATTEQFIPNSTMIINHRTTKTPWQLQSFVGGINNEIWLANLLNDLSAPDGIAFWLIKAIDVGAFSPKIVRSTQDAKPYDVQYTLVFNRETWHPVVAAINPQTGKQFPDNTKPPRIEPDAKGNGTRVVQTQRLIDFKLLPFLGGTGVLPRR